jgi:hypothetical protein
MVVTVVQVCSSSVLDSSVRLRDHAVTVLEELRGGGPERIAAVRNACRHAEVDQPANTRCQVEKALQKCVSLFDRSMKLQEPLLGTLVLESIGCWCGAFNLMFAWCNPVARSFTVRSHVRLRHYSAVYHT